MMIMNMIIDHGYDDVDHDHQVNNGIYFKTSIMILLL